MNQTKPITSLRDVLYGFSLEKAIPDAELLDEYARRYPHYAAALTDFAIEMIVDSATGEIEDPAESATLTMSPTVARAMSRFQNRLFLARGARMAVGGPASSQAATVLNPFATLDRVNFRDLVSSLRANSVFVAKLRDREIDPGTMTDGFRQRVANEVKAPLNLVAAHFAASSEIRPGQFYKSGGKPTATPKQSFQEAVKTSGLTEEQQRYLLGL
jgi:hypothetical protein